MCDEKFPLVLMGGRAEGLTCTDPGVRTPIGASGNLLFIALWTNKNNNSKWCNLYNNLLPLILGEVFHLFRFLSRKNKNTVVNVSYFLDHVNFPGIIDLLILNIFLSWDSSRICLTFCPVMVFKSWRSFSRRYTTAILFDFLIDWMNPIYLV